MGDKAEISDKDPLGYWHTDPRTDVILLYVEPFGNPRKCATGVCRRPTDCPAQICAFRARRPGHCFHNGAQPSASDMTLDGLFRQAGVMRTDTLYEMLDLAELPRSRHMPWLEHDLTPFEELAVPPLL